VDFLLVLAGVGGGLSGSIAGLASLVSYPVLLAVGLPPVSANVTNTVALIFQGIGNALGSGPELRGQGGLVRKLLVWSVPGGIIGGVLLLQTPSDSFAKAVPWLIAGASVAVLARPRSQVEIEVEAEPDVVTPVGPIVVSFPLLIGTFAVGIYGGYFGAAAGVLQLALLLIFAGTDLAHSSAIRSVVLTCANAVAAVYFMLFGPVDWVAALPLAIGFLIGGRLGPIVVRHAPAGALRVLIAVVGLGLAGSLAYSAYL
jgi:uncharacterized membrane protein YfcA